MLDNFAPFKKISNDKLKFKSKPWITPGLQKSISVKNKFLSDFIKKKDPTIKAELHLKYKNHRNLISTLLKRSKQNYYKKYFESNLNNSKNTWKGIKSIITMKNVISTVPRTLSHGVNTTTNPCEIANIFNNYFASVAETAKQNINYSHKHFSEYLKHQCNNSIFIQPTDSEEIANIISSLNINKACGPFSIPNKILILLKQDISIQLADLFNLSFSSGSFPSILKTAKVVPVFKKGSKLDCCNYCPISLLSNVEKVIEELMYKRVYNFLIETNIIYDLQFGFIEKFFTFHALISFAENIRLTFDEGYIG